MPLLAFSRFTSRRNRFLLERAMSGAVSTSSVLEFEYLKPVSKSTIIDASINELTKRGDVTSTEIKFWKRILDKGIVDMNAGEVASVSFTNEGMVTFYLDDRLPVSFKAPKFAKGFSSIWLGKNTSRPRLRQKLLGK